MQVIDAAADALGRDLEHCSPDTISNTMNSLAVFGRTHYPFLSKVAIAVRQRGSEFTNEVRSFMLAPWLGRQPSNATDMQPRAR